MLRKPALGLVIHADRRSQYTSHACRQRIEDAGALTSPPRPGITSQAEVDWSILKTDVLPYNGAFANIEEARLEVAYYLEVYFNLDHRHSALGYRSPYQFETALLNYLS